MDDKITLLQSGRVKFQFLEYLSANPGINLHELENLSYFACRSIANGAVTSSSTITPRRIEEIDFEEKEARNVDVASGEVEEGAGKEGEEKETIDPTEEEADITT